MMRLRLHSVAVQVHMSRRHTSTPFTAGVRGRMHLYLWQRWEAIPQLPVSHPLPPPLPPASSHVEKLIWTHPKQEALRNKSPLPTRHQGMASRHGVGGDDGRFCGETSTCCGSAGTPRLALCRRVVAGWLALRRGSVKTAPWFPH